MTAFLPHITLFTGQRSPSLGGVITVDGNPLNLGVATVNFKMREKTSATLKVNTQATVVTPSAGLVRYDWAAVDVDTPGIYDAWWHVNPTGPSSPEFLIEVLNHDDVGSEYVSTNELRETLQLSGTYADLNIRSAIVAASRVVDDMTGTSFATPGAAADRYYTPVSSEYLIIDPYVSITSVTYQGTAMVAGTDYYLDGNVIRKLATSIPRNRAQGVKVNAVWGYSTVPANVQAATAIIATQVLKRVRDAPFGVLATTIDGAAVRLGQFDPQVEALLAPFTVSQMIE